MDFRQSPYATLIQGAGPGPRTRSSGAVIKQEKHHIAGKYQSGTCVPGFHDTLLADESHSDQEKNHIISIVLLVRVYPTAPMPVLGHRYQVLIVRLTHRFTRYRNRTRRPKNWHQSSAVDCAHFIKCLKTHLTWLTITTADLVQVIVRTASLRLGPGFESMACRMRCFKGAFCFGQLSERVRKTKLDAGRGKAIGRVPVNFKLPNRA